MEGGIAAMPVNLLEHADHALTQFTRGAVTADAAGSSSTLADTTRPQ